MFSIISITVALTVSGFTVYYASKRKSVKKSSNQVIDVLITDPKSTRIKGKPSSEHLDQIATRMDHVLKKQKIFTNPDLKIQDLAAEVGTNRTYISSTINTFYNQNFTTFINQYRLVELSETVKSNNAYTHKELAMKSGFGSVDSMKRVIKTNTGLSLKHWKEKVMSDSMESDFHYLG